MNGGNTEKRCDWFFTFGCGGEHAQRFAKIFGTYKSARDEMVERHGLEWAFQYPTADDAGVDRWRLQELIEEEAKK